jgi:hypothetical protein
VKFQGRRCHAEILPLRRRITRKQGGTRELGAKQPASSGRASATDVPILNGASSRLARVQTNRRYISNWRRKLRRVAQDRERYALPEVGPQGQRRNFRAANPAASRHDDRQEPLNGSVGLATMVIMTRQSRDWLCCTRRISGRRGQDAGGELVFVNQCSVIGAPNVRTEEQMRRSPHVATERKQRKRGDERVTRSP